MDDFEEDLFDRDADAISIPSADPATIAGRGRRARIRQNVTRGSAGLALIAALGVAVASIGGDRPPTVQIVQPTDGITAMPTERPPVESGEPSPSSGPTAEETQPKPPPKPEYVPPLIGGEDNSFVPIVEKEALVQEDTNDDYDIYRQGPDGNVLVSVSDSEEIANGGSETSARAISRDGRYVAFWSVATNLTNEERGGLFVRDLLKGRTTLVRPIYDGEEVDGPVTPTIETAMSGDGRHIAFSGSTPGSGRSIFVHHLDQNVTEIGWETPDLNREFTLSYTGRFLAVIKWHTDTTENVCGTDDCGRQAYRRDIINGTTELLSVAPDGGQGNASSTYVYLSDDDRRAYFRSCATNLIDANAAPPSSPECTNAQARWFVRDLNSNTTTLSD